MKDEATRLAEINTALAALAGKRAKLFDKARTILLGKRAQRRAGDPTYEITFVGMNPEGRIIINGVRLQKGKRGNREFYIGEAKVARIWSAT